MLSGPGGRELPPPGPPLLSMVMAANTRSLERVRRLLEREPDCASIVTCDLANLLSRSDLGRRMLGMLPLGDCDRPLSCTFLP